MKTLLILRHAKSSWKDPDQADHDRPLNKRGRRDAPRMGRLLREVELVPDLIICSSAARAAETAGQLAEAADCTGVVEHDGRIYHADPRTILDVVGGVPDEHERVMVIGHNPGLEMLLEVLTGVEEQLPTAALAHVELEIDRWGAIDEERGARLVRLWRPRELE